MFDYLFGNKVIVIHKWLLIYFFAVQSWMKVVMTAKKNEYADLNKMTWMALTNVCCYD